LASLKIITMQEAIILILLVSVMVLLFLYYKSSKKESVLALELFQRDLKDRLKELRKLDEDSEKALKKAVSDYNASVIATDSDTKH